MLLNFLSTKSVNLIWLMMMFISSNSFSHGIHSSITKSDDAAWTINYKASQPIKRIAFARNPDNSRTKRWNPIDDDFRVVAENNQEFIIRIDGDEFTEVTLILTPTYTHLPKDYGPFSPFSDGGTLFYSGRFFACENECDKALNDWDFTLSIPKNEHVILNGEKIFSDVEWTDSNSGRNIYVGQQEPIHSNGFITLIDQGLPKKIKESLDTEIPRLTDYLEVRLGKLPDGIKPTLFASYAKVDGTSVQGGVLPNQIFMHWNRDDLKQHVDDADFLGDLLWTFAHEVGHYFQRFSNFKIEPNESWIHEGHAEVLANDVLRSIYPSADDFRIKKVSGFKKQCSESLRKTSLNDAAKNGEFGAYYTCGYLIQQLVIDNYEDDAQKNAVPYLLWKLFGSELALNPQTNQDAFLNAITKLTNKELAEKISRFINLKHREPTHAIAELLGED